MKSRTESRSRRRVKGVAAKLTLTGDGRLRLLSAKLRYKRRTTELRAPRLTGTTLRAKLSRRLARRLAAGKRVTLELKLAARPGVNGCGFGAPSTFRLRTAVTWVPR